MAEPDLLVVPDLADISEGNDLHLICSVKGTPPITFWWHRVGKREPLKIATLDENHADYHFTVSSKEQSGAYYCVMENRANNKVESNQVNIEGEADFSSEHKTSVQYDRRSQLGIKTWGLMQNVYKTRM